MAACSSEEPSGGRSSESRDGPPHIAAYQAGYKSGKAVYDASGKGAAVRETVWGGCTRRALDAGATAEQDRGAWVRGCLDGVVDKPQDAPTAPVTERAENPGLLKTYRSWAEGNGAEALARHAQKLTTTQLTERDYDIELAADYGPGAGTQPKALAESFAKWWDGDHGRGGVARNVLILGGDGKRLVAQRL
ncbi:hypothetical protein [Streptomyces melanogenes]|uniref:hypothetical protein n=1 Tax=Streptomyces melanogenes TaxID=67326 RepID=UPI00378BDFAB